MSTIPNIQQITSKSSFLDTKEFTIEILSPVHIGSGREFSKGLDYAASTNHTKFYDLGKIFRDFAGDEKFLNAIDSGSIQNFMDKNGTGKNYYKQEFEGSAEAATIREFMMLANGKPVIPGSSIKGAIRTAFYSKLFAKTKITARTFEDAITKNGRKKIPSFASSDLDALVLATQSGRKKPNYDFGRIVKVFDAEFSPTDLIVQNAKVLNLKFPNGNIFDYGWKNMNGQGNNRNGKYSDATPISMQSLAIDSESTNCKITLDLQAFNDINWPTENRFVWKSFAETMNLHAENMSHFEKSFLKKLRNDDDINDIDDELGFIDNRIIESKSDLKKISWVQQVGWGTGWHSKTGLSLNNEQTQIARSLYNLGKQQVEVFPKSRKIVGELNESGNQELPTYFMGWIKITEV